MRQTPAAVAVLWTMAHAAAPDLHAGLVLQNRAHAHLLPIAERGVTTAVCAQAHGLACTGTGP